MKELQVTDKDSYQRLDKYLRKFLNKAPSSFIHKMLRKRNIKLNNVRADGSEIVNTGDTIQIYMRDSSIDEFRDIQISAPKSPIRFNVLYEDKLVIFVDKPAGLLSQPSSGSANNSLNDQLVYYLYKNGEYNPASSEGFKPGICNRLDMYTSGIVASGKTVPALQSLNTVFKQRTINKIYLALVKGNVKDSGRIISYLTKDSDENIVRISHSGSDGAKEAILDYKPLTSGSKYSLVEVSLVTGISHQIRAQLASQGHPIVGDRKYGDRVINDYFQKKYKLSGQFLHCHKLLINSAESPLEYLRGKQILSPLPYRLNKIAEEELVK